MDQVKSFLLPSEKAISSPIKPGYVEPRLHGELSGMMDEYIALRN